MSVKITSDEEKRLFEKALRWAKEEKKEREEDKRRGNE